MTPTIGETLQTGFLTKRPVGLLGSAKLRLAVAADGSRFFGNANSIVDQPRLPRFTGIAMKLRWLGPSP